MALYVNIPPSSSGGVGGSGWEAERGAIALARCSTLNRFFGTDLDDGSYFLGGGGNAPTPVTTISGGVYKVPGAAGSGYVNIGKIDSQSLIASPKAESWYVASRVRIPSAVVFTAATFSIPIGIASATGNIYVTGIASQSTTIYQLNLNNGADHYTPLGSVGTLGSSTAPVGSFFVVSVYFNVVTGVLAVEFNDTLALSLTGAQLNNMITDASSIPCFANDLTLGMQCDALFYAHVAP